MTAKRGKGPMERCRICGDRVADYQTFCANCGARQLGTESTAEKSVLVQLKNSLGSLFRNREAWIHYESACGPHGLAMFGPEAAIPVLEKALALAPRNRLFRSDLVSSYVHAGTQRVVGPDDPPRIESVASFLRPFYRAQIKAHEILSQVRKVRQSPLGNLAPEYTQAYLGLDEAFSGALRRFDQALSLEPDYPRGYSGRAHAFKFAADRILTYAYGIWPAYMEYPGRSAGGKRGKQVQYGDLKFGVCFREKLPSLEFGEEILWLYEQAEMGYRAALWLDLTDSASHVELSHVLRQLGNVKEADESISKALFILNRAILADIRDVRSFSQRAEIWEEIGRIDLAIADLERALDVVGGGYRSELVRYEINRLRKRKVTLQEK